MASKFSTDVEHFFFGDDRAFAAEENPEVAVEIEEPTAQSSPGDDRAFAAEENPEVAVKIEEPVEATAQSIPAESPVDSQLPHVRIPKVPEGHGYGGRDAYEPRIISIGPYHRYKPRLLPMESLKHECFNRVKNMSGRNWSSPECFTALNPLEKEARRCYSENTDNIGESDFLEMMILDACFIIEYCICIKRKTLSDLVGGRIWMLTAIHNDLLLLENQLPFFVVEKIFDTFISPPGQNYHPVKK